MAKTSKRAPSVVGANIKRLRKALGMTQPALAQAIGYEDLESGRVYIGRIESGNVGIPQSNLVAIAAALHVTTDELLGTVTTKVDGAAVVASFVESGEASKLNPYPTETELQWLRENADVFVGPPSTPRSVGYILMSLRDRPGWKS